MKTNDKMQLFFKSRNNCLTIRKNNIIELDMFEMGFIPWIYKGCTFASYET